MGFIVAGVALAIVFFAIRIALPASAAARYDRGVLGFFRWTTIAGLATLFAVAGYAFFA